jgi:nicotinate-nucleotide adenylyltransferase
MTRQHTRIHQSNTAVLPQPGRTAAAAPLRLYYGGTFDPLHNGHLAIAGAARDELGVEVCLVPAADPPHRAPPGASALQRAQMVALAIADQSGLCLDERELQRAQAQTQPSYTVDTLAGLRAELGADVPLAWLLGADSLVGLNGWHHWRELLELAHIVVAERPGLSLERDLPAELVEYFHGRWTRSSTLLTAAPAGYIHRLQQPLREESASQVRRLIAASGAWQELLPASVAQYIVAHGLYGTSGRS